MYNLFHLSFLAILLIWKNEKIICLSWSQNCPLTLFYYKRINYVIISLKYYNNGYRLGVKKTNEELQKGDKALAVTLKNTADKLFEITPTFTKELNNSITNLVSNLCKEVLGYEIENNNSFFQEKIKKLIDSIENSLKDVKVFLNPLDHSCIEKYNKENDVKQKINFYSDDNLERGDIKIKSGSIEIAEIVSNKIKFAESQNEDFDDTKHDTQNLSSKTVQEK